ncbi:hypothetical protein FGIG_05566 [Fasciola gigantica]|uniref:Vacuolar protein sorting-associated protein 54 C-terminal domain-containing protein n=1 Tax=Fasciola gigantica TaxID=46835 RepID=A0A504Y9P4_FASGI|nr:hypothetical protein FGIG_05566 [Fasciola gigantica]
MFFESEFDLQQTGTFSRVIPLHPRKSQSGVSNAPSFVKSFDADDESLIQAAGGRQERDFRTQHERLTHYLDIVEVHLADQVSRKSSIFFEAVCCHDVVQEQLSSALDQIKLVRAKLGQVDSSITCGVMRLHRVIRRKANYRLLLEKLIPCLLGLLYIKRHDFVSAFRAELLRQIKLLQTSRPGSTTGEMTSSLKEQLRTMSNPNLIDFLTKKCSDLRDLLSRAKEASDIFSQTIMRSVTNTPKESHPMSTPLPEQTARELQQQLSVAMQTACGAAQKHIIDIISLRSRLTLNESSPSTTFPRASSSDAAIRSNEILTKPVTAGESALNRLSSEEFVRLVTLLQDFQEASDIFSQTIMRSVTNTPKESHPMSTPLPEQTARELQQQLSVAMQTACGAAQKHIIDIISLRSRLTLNESSPSTTFPRASSSDAATRSNEILTKPVTAGESALNRLSSEEFVRLVTLLQDFQTFLLRLSEKTEFLPAPPAKTTDQQGMLETPDDSVSNPTTALARLLLTLTRNSLQRFHHEHTTKLDMILNQERWHAIPVPSRVQNLVTHTFVNALRNATKVCLDSCSLPSSDTTASLSTDRHRQHFTSDDSVSTTLNFDGERFVVVGTVLLLLPMMADYVNLAPRLPCRPGSIAELASRLAELLNSFNSRTCQLVLGAEARKSADLPTISARNLALASRSVQLIARCVPPLQAYFTNLQKEESKNGQMLHPLYAVPKDKRQHDPLLHMENLFREHVDQISDKLYSLLSSRIQDRLCAWSVRPPTPSPEIRAICRALTRMVEMISDVMPIDMLQPIIFRAHVEFKAQLHHRLRELNITADGGPMQSLVDQELKFYASQLRSLTPELSKFEEDFSDVWPST